MGWWTSSASTFNFKQLKYDKDKNPIPVPAMIKMLGKEGLNDRSYIQAPLLCPLKEGETYEIEISYAQKNVRFSSLGLYFSDSFIHIPAKKVYTVDSLSGFFQVHQYDSLIPFLPQKEFLLKTGALAMGLIKQSVQYTATGKERFLLLGNFESDENTSYRRGFFGGKDPDNYISIHQITLRSRSGLTCDCEQQEEILETLNRRHSFFGACHDSVARDMNRLFSGMEIWNDQSEIPLKVPHFPKLEAGKAYRIERLYFAFDSSVIESRSFPSLDSLASLLKFYPHFMVDIIGHTDSLGNSDYNKILSQNRAEAVKSYLVSKGIAPEKLEAIGRGSTEPVAGNETEEGRQLNRRVEFILREE